jgi:outer membrane protein assembly complex protein YaeT
VAITAVALLAIVVIALLVLHTNPVQARILDWSIAELERRFDLDLVADDLHYNLAARRVTLTGVRLAAVGHHDAPFFSAANVTVKLPWAAYRGSLRFDEVIIDRGDVTITRDVHGVSNLPPGRARDPNAPTRRIDIRALTIHSLDFAYRDLGRDIEILIPHIRTDLAWTSEHGAKGPLAVEGDGLIRIHDRRVTMKPVTGTMAFDGSNVSLEQVRLDTSDADLTVSGEISRALDKPSLDLALNGTTDLAVSSRWAAPPIHVSGNAAFEAHMKGPPGSFVLDAHVSASDAQVGTERGVSIDAQSQLTIDRVTVLRSNIKPGTGGEIEATVDLPFAANSPWLVKASYRNVDAAAAFRLAEVHPLAFGAALSGDAVIEKTQGEPFRLEVNNVSVPRAAAGTAPLAGRVRFIVDRDRWRADQDHHMGSTHVTGQLGGVWNRQSAARSTFESSSVLAVTTNDVAEAGRYAGLFGFSAPDIVKSTHGPMTADVTIGGTFTDPRFAGTAASTGLDVPSLGAAVVKTSFEASRHAFNATGIDATLGTTTVQGDVLANLDTRAFTGALKVESPDAADLMTAMPAAIRLEGPVSAVATLGGTVDVPDIDVQVSGSDLTLGGQALQSLNAKAHVIDGGVNVDSLTLGQAGGGEVHATGRYEWGSRSYVVDLDGQNLVWRGTLARLGDAEARLAVKFAGKGTVDHPAGEGAVEFAVSGGLAGELIDRGVANVRLNGETAVVVAHIPALGALVTSSIAMRHPFNYEAVLVMNRVELAPIITLSGLTGDLVTGTVSLSANASGLLSDVTRSNVFVNLQDIRADVSGVPLRLVTPSRVAWDGAAVVIDALNVSVGPGQLVASGRLGETGLRDARWDATYMGDLAELIKVGRPFGLPADLEGTGPVAIDWESTGGFAQSTATIHLDNGRLGWASLPPVSALVFDARFENSTLNVTQVTGRWQDGGIEGAASIPLAVLEARAADGSVVTTDRAGFAKVRVTGLTEASFSPWLSSATLASIGGRLSATLDARVTRPALDGIAGTFVVDEADFTVAGVTVRGERALILELDGGAVRARDVEFAIGGSPVTVTGTANFASAERQLDLQIQGTADLQVLSAFTPAIATDGTAKVNVGIGGTFAAPVFNGRADISEAEVVVREPRIVISELNGTLAMDGQRVVFDAFNGTANGGRLTLDGGFVLEGFRPARGSLVVVVERAAVEYPEGLQSEANAIVSLVPGPTGWSLTGEVSVERSAYTRPISVAGLIAARRTRVPSAGIDESWVRQLRLNLWVTTLQDLAVDNNYGRFEVGGALRVIGTVASPVLAGRITLNEGGEVYLAGRTFHISRGSVSFTNPFRIEPEFDIELRTQVSGSDLFMSIDGSLDRLRTEVRSADPNIDSREAMSMLFGGLQSEDAITLFSAELLGATGRAFGLDTLRVERGFDLDEFRSDPGLIANVTDPSTRLTLSKRLRPDVEVIISQSLRESGGLTAVISYKPRRNIEIRTASRDNFDRSVALRHEITFGGAGSALDAAPAAPQIAEVTISGNPQRPTDELLNLLDLKVTDRFDFHRWQRDIDRLRAAYHDRGHYEVRVRGTRRLSDDGTTVVLDYAIQPGPITELVIEGHPLEASLQEDIREAWRRTIFDRFLLEEIRARITRHLVEENVIGSTVEAAVGVSTPERKEIRVTVLAGTQVHSREVRYSGNAHYDADRLNATITAAGYDVEGWLDPSRIAATLQDFYRADGYLLATVNADPPAVDGTVGVIAVRVQEGPRFVIGSIEFPGVSPQRLSNVTAAGLDSGVPFVTASIDAARERIQELYASEGFNGVQIEVDTHVDEERATVAISFAVLEGLQQILRDFTVQGVTRTQPDVVRRALRLRIGAPVNLADWSQARKRLYDTNVFRQVDIEPIPMDLSSEDSASGIQPVRAAVRVAEYPVWRLRYGTQFTDEIEDAADPLANTRTQSLGVLADLQNQNLFGRAYTAGIAGRYERNRQAGSLFLSNSSFFGLPIRSSAFVFTSRQRFFENEFTTIDHRNGVSAEQRWRPFRTAEMIWSYRYERSRVSTPDLPPGDIELLPVTVAKLNAAMYFDRRDDPTDPTRGWFTSGNWEQAIRALGSDYGSGKILLQQAFYRAVGRLTLAGRAQLGTGYGGEALIASERFLLGGATTVRGYAEDSLGPRDILGFPAGGDALLALNGELRFPVRGWVQGVGFVDAGNVFINPSDVSFRDLDIGYGVGLRLASPFAMLRLDFGIPASTLRPDRPANQLKSGRWYFGVGHIF